MRRPLLVALAALSALGLAAPALALPDMLLGTPAGQNLPDPFNPPAGDSRHVCVIVDKLDWYTCVYVPMP